MIEGFQIDRVLNLSLLKDQQRLREAVKDHFELSSLVDEYLDEYVQLFPEPSWQKIYSGGLLAVQVKSKQSIGFDLIQVLKLTKTPVQLRAHKGYERLVAGFKNASQISSTYFEAVVAGWCANRAVSKSIEFSPEVVVKGKYKHPEFLWSTELGNIYCECKRGDFLESKFHRMIGRLQFALGEIYDEFKPWDPLLRLDVRFESGTTNKIGARFKNVVRQASAALRTGTYIGQVFMDDDVSAILRRRDEGLPPESESLRAGLAEVGQISKRLDEATYLSLTMSLMKYRQAAAARLLHDARTPLPPDSVGAVCIELGGVGAAQQKLMSLIGQPSYKNTPWVSLWVNNEFGCALWRNDQPFDDGVLLEKG